MPKIYNPHFTVGEIIDKNDTSSILEEIRKLSEVSLCDLIFSNYVKKNDKEEKLLLRSYEISEGLLRKIRILQKINNSYLDFLCMKLVNQHFPTYKATSQISEPKTSYRVFSNPKLFLSQGNITRFELFRFLSAVLTVSLSSLFEEIEINGFLNRDLSFLKILFNAKNVDDVIIKKSDMPRSGFYVVGRELRKSMVTNLDFKQIDESMTTFLAYYTVGVIKKYCHSEFQDGVLRIYGKKTFDEAKIDEVLLLEKEKLLRKRKTSPECVVDVKKSKEDVVLGCAEEGKDEKRSEKQPEVFASVSVEGFDSSYKVPNKMAEEEPGPLDCAEEEDDEIQIIEPPTEQLPSKDVVQNLVETFVADAIIDDLTNAKQVVEIETNGIEGQLTAEDLTTEVVATPGESIPASSEGDEELSTTVSRLFDILLSTSPLKEATMIKIVENSNAFPQKLKELWIPLLVHNQEMHQDTMTLKEFLRSKLDGNNNEEI